MRTGHAGTNAPGTRSVPSAFLPVLPAALHTSILPLRSDSHELRHEFGVRSKLAPPMHGALRPC